MFVKLKLNENLTIGTIVSYDSENKYWSAASNDSEVFGVVGREPVQDAETLVWSAAVYFAGTVYAIADRIIPDEGGNLAVLNGKVYVDNTKDCGIISPAIINSSQRQAGDLVMIHIR
tara:strand:- start:434 stop:784 length:351 start_codon:yes stop_codon:yes gene_type:complete